MKDDENYLQLLAIFHYIMAAMVALVTMAAAIFPLFYFLFGLAFMALEWSMPNSRQDPVMIGWVFTLIFGALTLLILVPGIALAVCMGLAGRRLQLRRYYSFCFVVACVECALAPLGTVLGIFTIIVLQRPLVRQMFGVDPPVKPFQASGVVSNTMDRRGHCDMEPV